MLGNGPEAAEFYAEHFWDNFDFKDSTLIDSEQVTEPAFAQYLQVVSSVPYDSAVKSIKSMLGKAQASQTHVRISVRTI